MSKLREYIGGAVLKEGDPELLAKLRPAFVDLVGRLEALAPDASEEERLRPFEDTFETINAHEDDIETVERETILGAIYGIGAIVGLDRDSEFAEEWRGDW